MDHRKLHQKRPSSAERRHSAKLIFHACAPEIILRLKKIIMKKLLTFIFLAILVSSQLVAQKQQPKSSFGVEIDPIAYILNGYSVHGVYQPVGRLSFDAGIFGIEEPAFYSDNKDFKTMHRGVGVKIHYHINGFTTKGLYVGLGSGYSTTEATHKESKAKVKGHRLDAGIHAGYRFFMFKNNNGKGLYLTPWVSLDYQLYQDKIHFEQAAYKQNNLSVFPTVHIGYRF